MEQIELLREKIRIIMNKYCLLITILTVLVSCQNKSDNNPLKHEKITLVAELDTSKFKSEPIATEFDYPVGKPDGNGYYNAQKFGQNLHLGDDWNSVKGGNSDLGNPIYAVANGYVKFAEDIGGGWGKVVRIEHELVNGAMVESLYAHCNAIRVEEGSWVEKGEQIATIGTANGHYLAHLHFEIRDDITLPVGGGYSQNTEGYLDPTAFLDENRTIKHKAK